MTTTASLIQHLLAAERKVAVSEDLHAKFVDTTQANDYIDDLLMRARDERLSHYLLAVDESHNMDTVSLLTDAIEALEALSNEFVRVM